MSERVLKVALSGGKLDRVERLVKDQGWGYDQALGWLIREGDQERLRLMAAVGEPIYRARVEASRQTVDTGGIKVLEVPETRLPLLTIVQGNCVRPEFRGLVLTGTLVDYEAAEDAPQGSWAIVMLTPASLAKLGAVTGEFVEDPKYVFCPSEITAV